MGFLLRRLSADGFQDGVMSPIRVISLLGIRNMNYTGKSQSVNVSQGTYLLSLSVLGEISI